jgi:hypothetical protein
MARIQRQRQATERFANLAHGASFLFSGSRLRFLMVPLALLAFVVFLPPYSGSFIGDDYVQLDRVSDLLGRPWAAYELLNPFRQSWYFRPLQNLWFLLNRLLFDLNPFPFYHLQIAAHVLVMALLYRVARQFRLSPAAGLAGAVIFGFHGHFFDVVTWLSSIAIILVALFGLAAVSAFLSYLRRPERARLLGVTLLFVVLTMLSHEEGFLIVPFLFVLALRHRSASLFRQAEQNEPGPAGRRPQAGGYRLWATFALMLLFVAVYVGLQLVRPNLNITLSETDISHWSRYLSPSQFSQFLAHALVRATTLFWALGLLLDYSYMVTASLLVALVYGFWRGNGVIRLGLLWLVLHLAFIYWALWSYQSQFFAGRHLYNALIGPSLVVAALVHALMEEHLSHRPKQWQTPAARAAAVGALLLAALFLNARTIGQMHTIWLEMSHRDEDVRRQMQALMPHASADTHVFAHRFVTDASYLPATVKVWYNQPLSEPGGTLVRLLNHGRATRDFYLFDYVDGRLINLMPELQEHAETIFVWNHVPKTELLLPDGDRRLVGNDSSPPLIIAGPAGEQRLALFTPLPQEHLEAWLSLAYEVEIPTGSALRLAVRRPAAPGEVAYRVRLAGADGQDELLFEQPGVWVETAAGWHDVILPLDAYWGQRVTLAFEVRDDARVIGGGYWANMRFVID